MLSLQTHLSSFSPQPVRPGFVAQAGAPVTRRYSDLGRADRRTISSSSYSEMTIPKPTYGHVKPGDRRWREVKAVTSKLVPSPQPSSGGGSGKRDGDASEAQAPGYGQKWAMIFLPPARPGGQPTYKWALRRRLLDGTADPS